MKILHPNDSFEKAGFYRVDCQLDTKEATSIASDDKFCGFLAPPFPTAYHLRKAGLPVYARLSEFEPVNRLFDKFLVDPLASWGVGSYESLLKQVDPNHELIIICPSVHGHMIDKAVAKVALKYPMVKGFITSTPHIVKEVVDAANGSA